MTERMGAKSTAPRLAGDAKLGLIHIFDSCLRHTPKHEIHQSAKALRVRFTDVRDRRRANVDMKQIDLPPGQPFFGQKLRGQQRDDHHRDPWPILYRSLDLFGKLRLCQHPAMPAPETVGPVLRDVQRLGLRRIKHLPRARLTLHHLRRQCRPASRPYRWMTIDDLVQRR
jgi:hypothetical protein